MFYSAVISQKGNNFWFASPKIFWQWDSAAQEHWEQNIKMNKTSIQNWLQNTDDFIMYYSDYGHYCSPEFSVINVAQWLQVCWLSETENEVLIHTAQKATPLHIH